MPAAKKRYLYNFLYTDNTMLTYELNKDDFTSVRKAADANKPFANTSIGIISLVELRSAVEQKPLTEAEKKAKQYLESAVSGLTETDIEWENEQKSLYEKISHDEMLENGRIELI